MTVPNQRKCDRGRTICFCWKRKETWCAQRSFDFINRSAFNHSWKFVAHICFVWQTKYLLHSSKWSVQQLHYSCIFKASNHFVLRHCIFTKAFSFRSPLVFFKWIAYFGPSVRQKYILYYIIMSYICYN